MKTDDAKKIISTAIDREVEAYTFYRTVSDKVKDPALKKLFTELAGEEKQHREFLQGMLSKDVSKMHFDAKKDYKVVNALPSPPLSADMKPLDGIVVSIKKELEAMHDVHPARESLKLIRSRNSSFPSSQTWKVAIKPVSRTSTPTWPSPKSGNVQNRQANDTDASCIHPVFLY